MQFFRGCFDLSRHSHFSRNCRSFTSDSMRYHPTIIPICFFSVDVLSCLFPIASHNTCKVRLPLSYNSHKISLYKVTADGEYDCRTYQQPYSTISSISKYSVQLKYLRYNEKWGCFNINLHKQRKD